MPEDLRVANKPGELEGVRNDSGIVFTGKRPFAIKRDDDVSAAGKGRRGCDCPDCNGGVQMFDRLAVRHNMDASFRCTTQATLRKFSSDKNCSKAHSVEQSETLRSILPSAA